MEMRHKNRFTHQNKITNMDCCFPQSLVASKDRFTKCDYLICVVEHCKLLKLVFTKHTRIWFMKGPCGGCVVKYQNIRSLEDEVDVVHVLLYNTDLLDTLIVVLLLKLL